MADTRTSQLALFGGTCVHDGSWPRWPAPSETTIDLLRAAAGSGRWAVSGAYTGETSFEQRFATAFADYQGLPWAVPTTNGSAGLVIAMSALGIGFGDEVIVPGLTWVACASAAARLGAVPVIVDVDPRTLSISADAARAAVTDRTRAILIVHAYCSCADVDAFRALSATTGVPIVEDCSQAHGAEWNHEKVGRFGEIGVFSLQQTKVLTCGEGGVTCTASADLYDRLQQLRADGRRHTAEPVVGQLELEEIGRVHGHNHAMSEFHAAVALSQLATLDAQNEIRERNATDLARMLATIPGVSTLPAPAAVTRRTYYDYVIRLDPETVGPFSVDRVVAALTAELNLYFETLDTPLNHNVLYSPAKATHLPRTDEVRRLFDPTRFDLPEATAAHRTCVAFLHQALLGTPDDMAAIATAVEKVTANLDLLGDAPDGEAP